MSRWKSRLRRSVLGCAVALPILGVATFLWYRSAYTLPPEPPAESGQWDHNGYDTLVRAVGLMNEEHDGVRIDGPRQRWPDPMPTPYPLAARRKLVAANAPAIELMREALHQPFRSPFYGENSGQSGLDGAHARFRRMARLLALATQTAVEAGDPAAAVRFGGDVVEMGMRLPMESDLVAALVGDSCERTGQGALWRMADRFDASSARSLARRLEDLEKDRWPYDRTVRAELRVRRQWIRRRFAGGPIPSWRRMGPDRFPDLSPQEEGLYAEARPKPIERIRYWAESVTHTTQGVYYGPRQTLESLDTWFRTLEAVSRTPWSGPRVRPSLPANPLLQEVAGNSDYSSEFRSIAIRADAALLRTYLALRAYRLERAGYPESLDTLVAKGYLEASPRDPFSPARAPLRYRRTEKDTMALWSVGPDARDDGGRPVRSKDRDGKEFVSRSVRETSKGDIVARANTW